MYAITLSVHEVLKTFLWHFIQTEETEGYSPFGHCDFKTGPWFRIVRLGFPEWYAAMLRFRLQIYRLVGLVLRSPIRERCSRPVCGPRIPDRLLGLVVKVSAPRAEDLGFESRLRRDFSGSSQKMALQWLPCRAPGVIGLALWLVGLVSVYCDWVRWKVWSTASISVWQHIQLSEQIRPWDTLACCCDVKQATNPTPLSPWGFFSVESYQWHKIDTLYSSGYHTRRYRVSLGCPGVCILWWMKSQAWTATSLSVRQCAQLSEQIRLWDTQQHVAGMLECCGSAVPGGKEYCTSAVPATLTNKQVEWQTWLTFQMTHRTGTAE